jgi:hypothetical protein
MAGFHVDFLMIADGTSLHHAIADELPYGVIVLWVRLSATPVAATASETYRAGGKVLPESLQAG